MPKKIDLEKEFKTLYNKGFSDRKIARDLEVSKGTIRNWREKMSLESNFISTISRSKELLNKKDAFFQLYKEGLTDRIIGEKLGFSEKAINVLRNKLKLPSNIHNNTEITKEMEEVLIGTILGDAHINCRSYSSSKKITDSGILVFAHCEAQKEYCFYKYNILKTLFNREPQKNIQERKGKKHISYYATSKSDMSLRKYFDLFYRDFIKVIPVNLEDYLTEKGLAILFMDDGYSKQSREYDISLCGFDMESLSIFQKVLLNKWNIETSIHKSKTVYIKAKSREKFLSVIKPYIIPTMQYKIK